MQDSEGRPGGSIGSGPARVACITLDAAEHSFLRRWAGEGLLPTLDRLLRDSVLSLTRNPEIIYSGSLWASFNSGLWPGRHDNYFYLQTTARSYGLRRFQPEDLSVDSVWNAIARRGHRVAVIDVPKVRLERTSQTLQVSFWGEHEVLCPPTCWPTSFAAEVRRVAGKDPVGACDLFRQRPAELSRLRDALVDRAHRRANLALEVLARGPWDLFGLNFSEAHCAGHQLWATRDAGHPQHQAAFRSALGDDPLLDVYRAVDRELGRVVDALGDDVFLVVLATHGIGPRYDAAAALDEVLRRLDGHKTPAVSAPLEALRRLWLRTPGTLRGPFRRLVDRFYDFPRRRERVGRRFFTVPTTDTCGGIRVNLRGREPHGRVDPGPSYLSLCDWLERELLQLENVATGARVVTRVLRGDHLFAGAFRDCFPDLVVEWNDKTPIPAVRSPRVGEVRVDSLNPRTGDHRPTGLVLARGRDLAPRALDGAVPVVDIVPTLAARLGVEVSGIDGKPIPDFLPPGRRG